MQITLKEYFYKFIKATVERLLDPDWKTILITLLVLEGSWINLLYTTPFHNRIGLKIVIIVYYMIVVSTAITIIYRGYIQIPKSWEIYRKLVSMRLYKKYQFFSGAFVKIILLPIFSFSFLFVHSIWCLIIQIFLSISIMFFDYEIKPEIGESFFESLKSQKNSHLNQLILVRYHFVKSQFLSGFCLLAIVGALFAKLGIEPAIAVTSSSLIIIIIGTFLYIILPYKVFVKSQK